METRLEMKMWIILMGSVKMVCNCVDWLSCGVRSGQSNVTRVAARYFVILFVMDLLDAFNNSLQGRKLLQVLHGPSIWNQQQTQYTIA